MIITTEDEGIILNESRGSITYDAPDGVTITVSPEEVPEVDKAMEKTLRDVNNLFELFRQLRAQGYPLQSCKH